MTGLRPNHRSCPLAGTPLLTGATLYEAAIVVPRAVALRTTAVFGMDDLWSALTLSARLATLLIETRMKRTQLLFPEQVSSAVLAGAVIIRTSS